MQILLRIALTKTTSSTTLQRGMCDGVPFMKVFAPDRLQAMEAPIQAIANRLVDSFVDDGSADIITQFAYPLPLEAILTMYGVPLKMMPNIKKWCYDMTALFSSQLTPERQVECARSFVAMQQAVAGLIEERKNAPQDDLITHVLDSDLSLNELVIILCGLILAGHTLVCGSTLPAVS